MEFNTNFAPFQEQVSAALVAATKTAGQISSEDLDFQRSLNPEIAFSLDRHTSRLLDLANKLLSHSSSAGQFRLQNEDQLEDSWRSVVDTIDELLEKSDACLDEFTGVIKKINPAQQDQLPSSAPRNFSSSYFPNAYDRNSAKISKPQLLFENPVDTLDISFKPLLRSKPHALVSLSSTLDNPHHNGINESYVLPPPIQFM